ncbi:MAG: recombinase family protein [Planctomycetes bacterium]|nr:recombinase family protein [Planctomycetota bacterium]
MPNLIAYYRVSTRRQGRSGLGLEAQQADAAAYARQHGGKVLASYTEVETGKRADRPELARAIAHAKRARATLVVAKLDRLARNVAFTSKLMDSGVDFIACDNPHANRLTIHILAAVAEDEARRISERTKAALAAAKRRGTKLGAARPECRNLTKAARERGSKAGGLAVTRQADTAYADLRGFFSEMRPAFSYQQIATVLNLKGERTRRGKPWSDVAVMRACKRLEIA